jgi:hypothetical protein
LYNENLDITIELFLIKALYDTNFPSSYNPLGDSLLIKGVSNLSEDITYPTISPALYQRIYGDNNLTKFFIRKRDS